MTDYSKLTNEQVAELLATKVMGWHIHHYGNVRHWEDKDGRFMANADVPNIRSEYPHWNPPEDLNQAVECAKSKWGTITIILTLEDYGDYQMSGATLYDGGEKACSLIDKKPPARALCEAILQAVEEE